MFAALLLPGASDLSLISMSIDLVCITLTAAPTQAEAECPLCHQASAHVHSRYSRSVTDLPWAGIPVCLHLQVRKFFCLNSACQRVIFTERLPSVVAPSARRTARLAEQQRRIGLDHGGEPGMRTLQRLAMPISSDTVLRLVRRGSATELTTPRVLGVDDWAWRKRGTYGTILVDLEQHCPIDLLEDRTAEALASWLEQHPGVEIISRDRAGAYAEGATRGAPEAIQVADRFHLLQNLREALERLMDRNQAGLRAATAPKPTEEAGTSSQGKVAEGADAAVLIPAPPGAELEGDPGLQSMPKAGSPLASLDSLDAPCAALLPARKVLNSQVRRARRKALYEQVRSLYAQGVSKREIARHLRISRKRVRRFIVAESFPERAQPRRRASILDAHLLYLIRRWKEGCTNGTQLWRELCARGFRGSRSLVARWAACHRRSHPPPARGNQRHKGRGRSPGARRLPPEARPLSARQASWLLVRAAKELRQEEQETLERLIWHCADAATAYPLAQAFTEMVRRRTPEAYEGWLAEIRASGLTELCSLVAGLERDEAAVCAALRLCWSNGQTEGQITKLKLIKRQMYGRAKFDLLRQRVLAA